MNNGSVLRGTIVELAPGKHYRIAIPGGIVLVPVQEVAQVSHGASPSSPVLRTGDGDDHLPPQGNTGGLRVSVGAGVLSLVGDSGEDMDPGATIGGRLGYEWVSDIFGVGPSMSVRYAKLSTEEISGYSAGMSLLSWTGGARIAAHAGSAAPFVGVELGLYHFSFGDIEGPGVDVDCEDAASYAGVSSDACADEAFGIYVPFGVDVRLGRSVGLGLELGYHWAGFDDDELDRPNAAAFSAGAALTFLWDPTETP
jgi:hypothetical protein